MSHRNFGLTRSNENLDDSLRLVVPPYRDYREEAMIALIICFALSFASALGFAFFVAYLLFDFGGIS